MKFMVKTIRRAGVAVAFALVVAAPVVSAHSYAYYDRDGHRHYSHNSRYASRYDEPRYRSCGRAATKGTIIGGVGGAVLGQAIGHDTLGTVVGAGAGALAGRQIAKSNCQSR
jgi:hypothetical protein